MGSPTTRGSIPFFAHLLEIKEEVVAGYLFEMNVSGIITRIHDRDKETGKPLLCGVLLHGPWDNYGGSGVPFIEYSTADALMDDFEDRLPPWMCEMRDEEPYALPYP